MQVVQYVLGIVLVVLVSGVILATIIAIFHYNFRKKGNNFEVDDDDDDVSDDALPGDDAVDDSGFQVQHASWNGGHPTDTINLPVRPADLARKTDPPQRSYGSTLYVAAGDEPTEEEDSAEMLERVFVADDGPQKGGYLVQSSLPRPTNVSIRVKKTVFFSGLPVFLYQGNHIHMGWESYQDPNPKWKGHWTTRAKAIAEHLHNWTNAH